MFTSLHTVTIFDRQGRTIECQTNLCVSEDRVRLACLCVCVITVTFIAPHHPVSTHQVKWISGIHTTGPTHYKSTGSLWVNSILTCYHLPLLHQVE